MGLKTNALISLVLLGVMIDHQAVAAPKQKLGAKTESRIDARLYSQPNSYGKPLSIVGRGLELDVLRYSSSKSWALVETPSKRRGWIPVHATTLGLRYSPDSLADSTSSRGGGAANAAPARRPASVRGGRGPASDNSENLNLDDLGYDASEYEDDAQQLADSAIEASNQAAEQDAQVTDQSQSSSDDSAPQEEYQNSEPPAAPSSTVSPEDYQPSDASEYDGGAAPDVDTSNLQNELNAASGQTMQDDRRKPLRGVRIKDPNRQTPRGTVAAAKPISQFVIDIGAEYANQLNLGAASGFGFGLDGTMAVGDSLRVGLGFYWDRFVDKAAFGTDLVSRRASVLRVGPLVSFQKDEFGIDLMVSFTRTSTSLTAVDVNGAPISNEYAGAYSESTFGLRIAPHYDFEIGPQTALRAYVAYSLDFYKHKPEYETDSGMPHTLSVGAAISLGL